VGLIIKKHFMIGVIILILALSGTVAWLWLGGIDYMQKFHPNYKGEDFLNWDIDEQDKEQIL
jgi:hypothetical protein